MMKRVLTVLEYGGAAGQDIVRGAIYKPYFDSAGIVVDYAGRHPAGLRKLRSSSSRLVQALTASFEYKALMTLYERAGTPLNDRRIINRAGNYDVIHLVKISSFEMIRSLRNSTSARLVYDLADALWLPFFQGKYSKVNDILTLVDAVTGDNEYALEYARKFNSEVHLWPSISQVEKFDLSRGGPKPSDSSGILTIGWIGGMDTAYNLYKIWEVLERLFEKYPNIRLRLVGVGQDPLVLPQFEHVRYSVLAGYTPDVMVQEALAMDIGIFPMFDTVNSAVRGVLKALVYMSGEAAVIASPRGEVPQLIRDGANGYLADTDSEWFEKLSSLIDDSILRRQMAKNGLETVREKYTVQHSFDCLRKAYKL